MTARSLVLIAVAFALAACGKSSPPPTPAPAMDGGSAAGGRTPEPPDPQLAKVFDQTCKACHTNPGSGAPQSGDRKAWEPRLAQGMPTLLQHAISGFKGMPPMGSCMDCDEAQFEALIKFMAGAQ